MEEADSQIKLPKDQIRYAQFWFVNMTKLDEIAFNNLISGQINKAEEIWQKKENASSLQNRIVCALMFRGYASALSLAELLYGNEEYVCQLVDAVVGTGVKPDAQALVSSFLEILCQEFGVNQVFSHITNSTWKKQISQKAVSSLVDKIQRAIEIAKNTKHKDPLSRLKAGQILRKNTKNELVQLKGFLSRTEVQYQILADKLANEILQCVVDYNDSEEDDGSDDMIALANYALSVAVSEHVRDRCEENIDKIKEKMSVRAIQEELQRVNAGIEKLHTKQSLSLRSIKQIVKRSIPDIQVIKNKLGGNSDVYISISSALVSATVNAVVRIVNNLGDRDGIYIVRATIVSVISLFDIIGGMDMDFKTRKYFNENNSTLQEINRTLSIKSILLHKFKPVLQLLMGFAVLFVIIMLIEGISSIFKSCN